jgi:hypothetical protein
MRLGLSSIIGDSFGTGSFGIDGASTPPSYPPAGTYYDTQYGVEYPIGEGGAYLISPLDASQVPTQTVDVDREHDGAGGIVYDWTTASNVLYKVMGTNYATDANSTPAYTHEIPTGSGIFYSGGWEFATYEHDGFGGTQSGLPVHGGYQPNGTFIVNVTTGWAEVPSASGNYFPNGFYDNYTWDGSGNYNVANLGGYEPNGTFITSVNYQSEVPSGSGVYFDNGTNETYTWDGNGSYNSSVGGSYHSYGTHIYNDGTFDYYWDGSGGYYT